MTQVVAVLLFGVFGFGFDLVDVERDQVHLGPMVATIPAVAFEKAVGDVLSMGVLVVYGYQSGDFRSGGHESHSVCSGM